MNEQELYYLKSCLETMRAFRALMNTVDQGFSLGDMVLADNIDWLDCFIDSQERGHDPRALHRVAAAGG